MSSVVDLWALGRTPFLMGDTSSWSLSEEHPRGLVTFDHDFYIDCTEVSQSQFSELMGLDPSAKASGIGPSLPVHDASWFDAALYCNARSKRDGFDTVYRYTGLKQEYLEARGILKVSPSIRPAMAGGSRPKPNGNTQPGPAPTRFGHGAASPIPHRRKVRLVPEEFGRDRPQRR